MRLILPVKSKAGMESVASFLCWRACFLEAALSVQKD